jgi:5-methylcytosine-specific restriction endonuclease McrA
MDLRSGLKMTKKTLLLSSIYEPIGFISERKLISLMIREVVDVESIWDDDTLFSKFGENNQKVYRPAVVKLIHNNSRPARVPTFRRTVVFSRDNWCCQYCGRGCSTREATIDHVKPKSRGGPTSWRNCVTACRSCNRKKDDMTPEEAGMPLLQLPKFPTLADLWESKNFGLVWHHSWNHFIPR